MLFLDEGICALLDFSSLCNSLSNLLLAFATLLVDVMDLLFLQLSEVMHLLLFVDDFAKAFKRLLFLIGATCRGFYNLFETLVIEVSFLLAIDFLPILGSLLSHLQLDFKRVERFNNRLVSIIFGVDLTFILGLLPLHDVSSIVLGLDDLISKCFHSPIIDFLLVLLVNFERLKL